MSPPPWPASWKAFWILGGGLVILIWGAALGFRLQVRPGQLHDYSQDWCSARNYYAGQPIYLSLDDSVPLHFGGGTYRGGIKRNAHPPPSVLISLPWGVLGYRQAMMAWNLFSLLLLAPTLWLILRPAGLNLNPWMTLPIICITLVSNALAQQINQGQWNLVLLFLLTAAWSAQRRQRDVWGGVALGTAISIKLIPGFLLLYFLVQRRWTAIVATAATVVVWFVLSGLTLGWDCIGDYAFHVLPSVDKFRDFWPNASLAGFWAKLFDGASGRVVPIAKLPWLSHGLTLLTSCATVGLTAWIGLKAKSLAQRDVAWAAAIVAMMLVSPVTWDHYFLMLGLPLLIFWKRSTDDSWSARLLVLWGAFSLIVLNAKHLWDRFIPGDGEVVLLPSQTPSVATPLQVLTVISYPCYTLALLLIAAGYWVGATEHTEDMEAAD